MPKEFKLSKPVKTHAGDITTMTLKDPAGSLVLEYGLPFEFIDLPDDQGRRGKGGINPRINGPIMARWLSRLSGYDEGVMGLVHPRDLQAMMLWVGDEIAPAGDAEAAPKNSEG